MPNHAAFRRYSAAAKEEARRKRSKSWVKKRTKEKIRPKSMIILAPRMSTLMKMVTPWTALRYAGFANVSSLFMYTSTARQQRSLLISVSSVSTAEVSTISSSSRKDCAPKRWSQQFSRLSCSSLSSQQSRLFCWSLMDTWRPYTQGSTLRLAKGSWKVLWSSPKTTPSLWNTTQTTCVRPSTRSSQWVGDT